VSVDGSASSENAETSNSSSHWNIERSKFKKRRESGWAGFRRDQPRIVELLASLYFMKPEQEI